VSLLEIKGLTKQFGGLTAVKNVDFDIDEGEIVSIIGPNGAGKTTIFNLISGFYPVTAGTMKFKGRSIVGLKPHQVCQRGIGRTFQIVKPFGSMTVLENVLVAGLCRFGFEEARDEAMKCLEFTGLAERADQPAKSLTLGGRKRLEMARAIVARPDLVLLDEVVAGLNPRETEETIQLIRRLRERGVSAAAGVEHVMRVVMTLSDRVIVLNHGEKIAEGTPQEIAGDRRVIEAYLGEGYAQS